MQKACLFALLGIVLPSIGAGQDVLRSDQYGDELPLGALQRFGSVRFRQPMGCDAVAVSPDGKLLASGSRFYVRMWDLASGERILQDRMGCTALAFSHDGRLLACGGDDGKFKLWDVKRGVEVFSATHPASPGQHRVISEIAFWPDDLVFATAGGDNDVRVWDTTTGRNLLAFRHGGEEASTLRIAIAPDGRYLASSKGAEIRVWDAQEGGDPVVISAAHPRGVAALAFSSDSGTLISGGRRREVVTDQETGESRAMQHAEIRTWDPGTGEEGRKLHDEEHSWLSGLEVRRNRLVAALRDRLVVFNLDTDEVEHSIPLSPPIQNWHGHALALDREGAMCAVGSDNSCKPVVLNLDEAPSQVDPPPTHLKMVRTLVFAPDGRTLMSGCGQGVVRSWDIAGGRQVRQFLFHEECLNLMTLTISRDGRFLAAAGDVSGDEQGLVKIWDAATGVAVREYTLAGLGFAIDFSPDGTQLAVAARDFVSMKLLPIVVFDLDTDGAPKRLANEPSGFQAVRFLDQDRLVGVCRVLHVWQWKTGDTEQVFRAWNAEEQVWLSGDGGWAAVQDGDRVTLWDTAFGNAGVTINGRLWAGGAHAVAFSPDARRIATTTRGDTIHVYETATGKEVLQFASPDRRVASMTFSPDGHRLATGMDDGTVMLWDTAESTRN